MGEGRRRGLLTAWLAVAFWVGVIWLLGSEWFSAGQTGGVLAPLLRWLAPGIEPAAIRTIHGLLRQAAHLVGYAVLALLALRALQLGTPGRPLRAAGWAGALVLAVAVADETRQARLDQRTGSPAHVALDLAGGGLALAGAAAIRGLRRRRSGPHRAPAGPGPRAGGPP